MILCLESSADPTVIGLARDENTVSERVIAERDRMAGEVETLLKNEHVTPRELLAIAVGIGPGSFTGLRVSLAFAKGMARALQIPIWPVDSLKIIAANAQGENSSVMVISPARRGQAHCAILNLQTLEKVSANSIINYSDLPSLAKREMILLGPGVFKIEPEVRVQIEAHIPDDPAMHRPHAVSLAQFARELWSNKAAPDFSSLVPNYGLDFPAL